MVALRKILLASCSTAIAFSTSAAAQDRSGAPVDERELESASVRTAVTESNTIIVTARRREESILDVPLAVNVVTGEQLAEANITQLGDIARVVPALFIAPVAGRTNVLNFSIRGQNDLGGSITSDPAVGVYFADAVQTRPQGGARAFYDIASIQVLKGPQGTLFGRNFTGGAVLIQPVVASPDAFSGYVQGTYGNYDRRELQGAVNVPLSDNAAIRIASNLTRRDGFITNITTGTRLRNDRSNSVRGSFYYSPSDEFENVAIVDYFEGRNFGGGFAPTFVNPAVNQPFNTAASRLAVLARQQGRSVFEVEETNDSPSTSSNLGFTNTTTFDFISGATIKNIFGLRRVRSSDFVDEGFPQPLVDVGSALRHRQISEELQVSGSAIAGRLDYIVGGYFFWETGVQTGRVATFGGRQRISVADAVNESKSVFAQFDYEIVPKLSVTAGGRYTWDRRQLDLNVTAPNGAVLVDAQRKVSFSEPTYTLSLNYKPTKDSLLYLATRRGYRSGGFNSGAVTPAALNLIEPEVVTDIELGGKIAGSASWLDYRFAGALFRSKYDNIQRGLVVNAGTPPAPTRVILNAATATIKGGEAEAFFGLFDRFDLNLSVSYTNTNYDEFVDPLSGADLSDRPFAQTPKWTYRIGGRYHTPLAGVGEFSAGLDYSYRSEFLGNEGVVREGYILPGYGLLSARISLDNIADSGLRIAAFATNLTEKEYSLASVPFLDFPFGLTATQSGDPRFYGVEVGYRF